MWLIKSKITSDEFVWSNKKTDDFLQFIPKALTNLTQLVHSSDDFEANYVDATEQEELDLRLIVERDPDRDLIAKNGKIEVINHSDPKNKVKEKDFSVKKMDHWPYEKDSIKSLKNGTKLFKHKGNQEKE